ncbi:MAG: hypothetical protein U5K69_05005 [Balneolaceae bacterium]|nr:hypothetical protein [Balneolaceae bacterium]
MQSHGLPNVLQALVVMTEQIRAGSSVLLCAAGAGSLVQVLLRGCKYLRQTGPPPARVL